MQIFTKIFLVLLVLLQSVCLCLLLRIAFYGVPIATLNTPIESASVQLLKIASGDTLPATQPQLLASITETQLRDIIRSELASNAQRPAKKLDTHNAQFNKIQTDVEIKQQQKAQSDSNQIVQNAIANREWSRANSQELAPLAIFLSQEQKTALLDQLYRAVNRQELELKDIPPL